MSRIVEHFDWHDVVRYVEPFCGAMGAAVNSGARDRGVSIVLCDFNWEIVNLHEQLLASQSALQELVNSWGGDEETYYAVRSWDRVPGWLALHTDLELAARTLYLNKRGFNGLYRINRDGYFNVSWNSAAQHRWISTSDCIELVEMLRVAKLSYERWETLVSTCGQGDIVYCDPPYVDVKDPTREFSGYVGGFGWAEQVKLRDALLEVHARGARVYISNAKCQATVELYSDFNVVELGGVRRSMSSRGDGRKPTTEILAYRC
jgi:DNA adenine methylase